MPLILNIDAAVDNASVCLSDNEDIITFQQSAGHKDHAAFLQPAVKNIFTQKNLSLSKLDAVAVTIGPGSYTGLRVALASVKGICYALQKPLITVSTLEVMAKVVVEKFKKAGATENYFFCPMIDARRMEVFTALYDQSMNTILPPAAMILDESSFKNELKSSIIIFSGNGSLKFRALQNNAQAIFDNTVYDARDLVFFAEKKFYNKKFEDIAYTTPLYLKEFFTQIKNNK